MEFGKETRKFTADILTKVAEYLFAIIILGSIISGRFSVPILLISGIVFFLLVVFAIILVATTENMEGQ